MQSVIISPGSACWRRTRAVSPPARVLEAKTHLLQAIQLGCPIAESLPLLARLVLDTTTPSAGDIAILEGACQALPGRYDLKIELANVHLNHSR